MVNSRQTAYSKLKAQAPNPADICLRFLIYLSNNQDALIRFVDMSGISLDTLRQSMEDAETQGGLLDFLLSDETMLLAFTSAEGLPPEAPMMARHALDGNRHAEF